MRSWIIAIVLLWIASRMIDLDHREVVITSHIPYTVVVRCGQIYHTEMIRGDVSPTYQKTCKCYLGGTSYACSYEKDNLGTQYLVIVAICMGVLPQLAVCLYAVAH